MAILPLVIAPDERLKTKSQPIEKIDADIKRLAADMLETMYAENGIGLAAVQVGVLKRMLVADVSWREGEGPGKQYVLINPEVVSDNHEMNVYKEGCLSFPDQFADVERPKTVRIRYTNLDGETEEGDFDGLLATCIQHEIDHLNGVVFVDYISPVKRDMIHRKLNKMKKMGMFDQDHHHVHGPHCNHDHNHKL
jgi:peptide deformylase